MPQYRCDLCDMNLGQLRTNIGKHQKTDRHLKARFIRTEIVKKMKNDYDELEKHFNILVELIQGCDTPDKLVKLKTLEQLCD